MTVWAVKITTPSGKEKTHYINPKTTTEQANKYVADLQSAHAKEGYKYELTTMEIKEPKHYFIKMTDKGTGRVLYKRYKCIDGFCPDKSLCWQFSKQGANSIIERLEHEYRRNPNIGFSIEAV